MQVSENDEEYNAVSASSALIEEQPLLKHQNSAFDDSDMHPEHKDKSVSVSRQDSNGLISRTVSEAVVYRTYKRRWLGLTFVALLNFMSAFSIIIYAPVADSMKTYFALGSLTPVNWIYISAMFIYVVVSPVSMWLTHRGAKTALTCGAVLLILGSWLRYLGARIQSFNCVLFGSVLCGASQPFALNIATHYADLWFAHSSRVTATALMSLANPLGQAVASLVVPFMAPDAAHIPDMSLYVAILFTITSSLSVFTPTKPPSPVRAVMPQRETNTKHILSKLVASGEFRALFVQLSLYIALFNAIATLIEQITHPYGFTDVAAGILGAVQVVFGLITSIITAPILDKSKAYKAPIAIAVLGQSAAYLALIFIIRDYNTAIFIGTIIFIAMIGAGGLVSLPLALELAADVTAPIRPEVTSTIIWMGGQLMSGIVIVIADALRDNDGYYTHSLIFMAVVAMIPLPFAGYLITSKRVPEYKNARSGID